MSLNILIIDGKLERIKFRYDPENDVIPGAPSVTWADMQLTEAICLLLEMIEAQQK